MKPQRLALAVFGMVLATGASAQDATSFAGRWDLSGVGPDSKGAPEWMELKESDGHLTGRVQPSGGAWNVIAGAEEQQGKLVIDMAAKGSGKEDRLELRLDGPDRLEGEERRESGGVVRFTGVRAPALDRPEPKSWTKARSLLDGKDLRGWEPVGNVENNKWVARDGELVNDNPEVPGQRNHGAANLRTTETFQDFKLHIEVNCPEGGNSGIYLRGRYEVQVGTEGGTLPSHEMGAIYSYYPPPAGASNDLGRWTAFDITLVGRHVTVLRDGKMYHDDVELAGPTGGALDSHEAEPGPIYLQGDHHGVIRYRNIRISVPAK